jgi:hypothetical protein
MTGQPYKNMSNVLETKFDPISMATIYEKPDKVNKNQTDFSDIDQVVGILEIGIQLR